jgi:hypothetical protein
MFFLERKIRVYENKIRRIQDYFKPIQFSYMCYKNILYTIKTFSFPRFIISYAGYKLKQSLQNVTRIFFKQYLFSSKQT